MNQSILEYCLVTRESQYLVSVTHASIPLLILRVDLFDDLNEVSV